MITLSYNKGGIQMRTLDHDEIVGKEIFATDGHELGEIVSLQIDADNWRVLALNVKLNRSVHEDLKLKKPLLGSQTVQIRVSEISGIADSAILRRSLKDVLFSGGHPSGEDGEPTEEHTQPSGVQ